VGYGKRRATPFQGRPIRQSARPASRIEELKTLLSEALNEPVVVARCGHRKITSAKRSLRSSSTRSATADLRAIKILLDMLRDIESQTVPASPETAPSPGGRKVIEQLRARFANLEPDHEELKPGRSTRTVCRRTFATFAARCFYALNRRRAGDELASPGHRRQADRPCAKQDPAADHQLASPPPEILDGLDRGSQRTASA